MFDNIKTAISQIKENINEKVGAIDWLDLSKKTFKVCRWFNIELTKAFDTTTTVHWSVLVMLLILLIFKGPLLAGIFTLALLCVVPHEYGHALAARWYDLKTRNIFIYPVGGVALVEGNAHQHMVKGKELVIAAAGPAVSFLLSFIGFLGFWLSGPNHLSLVQNPQTGECFVHQGYDVTGFWFYLGVVNLGMVLFNLIPAFPMDGGRMFRATLSCWLGQLKATKIAYYVSVGLCYFLCFVGLLTFNPSLILIPLAVIWMAKMELRRVQMLETQPAEPEVDKEPKKMF